MFPTGPRTVASLPPPVFCLLARIHGGLFTPSKCCDIATMSSLHFVLYSSFKPPPATTRHRSETSLPLQRRPPEGAIRNAEWALSVISGPAPTTHIRARGADTVRIVNPPTLHVTLNNTETVSMPSTPAPRMHVHTHTYAHKVLQRHYVAHVYGKCNCTNVSDCRFDIFADNYRYFTPLRSFCTFSDCSQSCSCSNYL